MTINVGWYEHDASVIRINYIGNWTLEEYYGIFPVVDKMIRESGKRITCLMSDSSWTGVPPKNVMAGFKKSVLSGKIPIIFVKIDPPSRMMIVSLRKAYGATRPVYFVNTLEEANVLIDKMAGDTGNLSGE